MKDKTDIMVTLSIEIDGKVYSSSYKDLMYIDEVDDVINIIKRKL